MEMAVASYTKRPEMHQNILSSILGQTRKPDVVSLVFHKDYGDIDLVRRTLIEAGIPKTIVSLAPYILSIHDVQRLAYSSAETVMLGGSISEMEDDDWYGPGYLAEVEAVFMARPEAVATGKNEATMRLLRDGNIQERQVFSGGINPDGSCINVLGSSISVSVKAWRELPWIRFRPIIRPGWTSFPDCDFMDAMRSHNTQTWPTGPDNYAVQRYYDPDHDHAWKYQPQEFQ